MARFGFCGPTFQSLSPTANSEWAVNLYLETPPSPNARSAGILLPTDGLKLFAQLPSGQSVPGGFSFKGRTFAVGIVGGNSLHLYEISSAGNVTDRGALDAPVTTAPAIWAANPTQLAFTVGGTGNIYVLTLATNVITKVLSSALAGNALSVAYLDGFGVCLIAGTNTFQISAIEDFTTWPALNIGTISEFPDPAVGMIVSNRTLGFIGQKQSVPYYNSGALFPFVPVPNVLIEEGGGAPYGISKLDNTVLWLGANVDQGGGVAWRLNGYTPTRISNHDIETIWQNYPTIADAITYTFQSRGHKFWHIYFPTANASWRYDIATSQWHQIGTWNQGTSSFTAHRSAWHTYNFGLHLVGDPFSNNIYSMSPNYVTDNGTPIRRVRRAPYIAKEHEWVFHSKLEVLAEMGLPTQIPAPSNYPTFLNLTDANGVLWAVTIADNGTVSVNAAAAGQVATPGQVVLADSVNQTTFWLLTVSTLGVLSGTSYTGPASAQIAIYNMATGPSFLASGLTSDNAGNVTAVQPQQYYREPQLMLRWSDDGGHTWSNGYPAGLGETGDFKKRAIWRRLGKSRNRVYEVSCDDPVSLRIIDAFVNDPGGKELSPKKRLTDQFREMA
jgi:hypothetical protein